MGKILWFCVLNDSVSFGVWYGEGVVLGRGDLLHPPARTTDDPRTSAATVLDDVSSAYPSSIHYYGGDDDDGASDKYSCSRVASGDDDYNEEDKDDDTADSSATSPTTSSIEEPSGSQVLGAADYKAYFMYFMVPKCVDACPKCSGTLLHLGRNGCV
ncbi:hypothetical protein Cni_G07375 [Canna indica]|uniref:Uncharacterized protein n=1 Tax=Canna indica TaxID=4628 RepID=A0AAQ3Q5N9_9LILI|nr:hypothetical protein Cni_G07375 [Canna indica]